MAATHTTQTISKMPLNGRGIWITVVSSMEQIIGAGLSTVIGIMLPMLQMLGNSHLPSFLQGIIGATGLIGIAIGSYVIGNLMDKQGYLIWFRLCPVMIIAGALVCIFVPGTVFLIIGLLLAGIGVGGGYSLDSAYISELLPERWRLIMVGIAKATSSLGFILVAFICWIIIKGDPVPELARPLMWIIAAMGIITFLMRIRWAESPRWLMQQGREAQAQKAIDTFYGPSVSTDSAFLPSKQTTTVTSASPRQSMWKGENLRRVIFSGIPWACEGLGVYGFGVFLPVLVMALGIESSSATGMHKVVNSVATTALVNFFILPGFIIGLLIMHKVNHVKMLSWGFIFSAIGLAVLYLGYIFHAPHWILISGFVIFEVALNAGPHLITYIIPSRIYPVAIRGEGSGIAAMLGKVGAIVGVIVMPIMISEGGPSLALLVSIAVMILGALISIIYGKKLQLL